MVNDNQPSSPTDSPIYSNIQGAKIGFQDPDSTTLLPQIQPYDSGQDIGSYSWGQTFAAAFKSDFAPAVTALSSAISLGKFFNRQYQDVDPNYNPFDDIKGTKYEQYHDHFMYSPNAQYTQQLKDNIDKQEHQADIIANGSGSAAFLGSFATGFFDPINYLPLMGIMSGGSRLLSALTSGGLAVAGTAVNEAARHTYDPTRTMGDSYNNIFTTSLFAGISGGILGGSGISGLLGKNLHVDPEIAPAINKMMTTNLSTSENSGAAKLLASDATTPLSPSYIKNFNDELNGTTSYNLSGGSAFKFTDPDGTQFEIAKTNLASEGMNYLWKKISPLGELYNSPNPLTRELANNLVTNAQRITGDFQGMDRPFALDYEINDHRNSVTPAIDAYKDAFMDQQKAGSSMRLSDFGELVTDEMNGLNTGNRYAKQAAMGIRPYLNDMRDQLIATGKWPEDAAQAITQNSDSYFTKLWQHDVIDNRLKDFTDRIDYSVANHREQLLASGFKPEDIPSAQFMKDSIIKNMLDPAVPSFRKYTYNFAPKAGQLQERTLNLPYEDFKDFLVRDPVAILQAYSHDVSPQIVMQRKFGSTDLKPQFDEIMNWYNDKIQNASSNKEAKALKVQMDKDVKYTAAIRDQLLGKYGQNNTSSIMGTVQKGLISYNLVRLLGMGIFMHLNDLSRLTGVVRLSQIPLLRNLIGGLQDEVYKMSDEEARQLLHYESIFRDKIPLGDSAQSTLDYMDGHSFNRKSDRFFDKLAQYGLTFNFMSPINDRLRPLVANVSLDNIIKDLKSWKAGSISNYRLLNLTRAGINEQLRDNILDHVNQFATKDDSGRLDPNLSQWHDETGLRLRSILTQHVDQAIIKPTFGEKPLPFTSNWLGRLIGQFRGWQFGTFHKNFLPMVQDLAGVSNEATLNSIAKIFNYTALGSLLYMARQKVDGKPPETDMRKLVLEGIDRGGVLPVMWDLQKVTDQFGLGVSSALGLQKPSKQRTAEILTSILGPTSDLVNKNIPAAYRVLAGNASKQDKMNTLKLIPGIQLPYINFMTQKMLSNLKGDLTQ